MPAVEYVVGFECDLSNVTDVAVQEAVHALAQNLEHDNEHDRPLEHLDELFRSANRLSIAAAAIDGEHGA
jgi:hypothetical protein